MILFLEVLHLRLTWIKPCCSDRGCSESLQNGTFWRIRAKNDGRRLLAGAAVSVAADGCNSIAAEIGGYMASRLIKMLLLVTMGTASAPSWAVLPDISTGNGLYQLCTSQDSDESITCISYVFGYVIGAESAALEIRRMAGLSPTASLSAFCRPNGVTAGQLKDIAVKFLTDTPEGRHLSSSALLMVAFERAFPCQRK
jgi:Ssp1 endopeptidase immunity protein Rap1a